MMVEELNGVKVEPGNISEGNILTIYKYMLSSNVNQYHFVFS